MAAKTAPNRLPVSRRVSRYAPYPAHGPTIAIEKAFAPSVVIPPCASSSAWNSSTMVPSSAMTGGRNSTAPAPVPVGWLELPVTEGSLIALSTKVNAPAAPSSRVASGCSRTSLTTVRAPCTTNGAAAMVQPTACAGGRNPSAMCMRAFPPDGGARRDEPLRDGRLPGPVQVQVRGVHAAGDEALRRAGRPLPRGGVPGGGRRGGAVDLVPAHPGPGGDEPRVRRRHGGPVAEGEPRGHRRRHVQDAAHRHPVEAVGEVQQTGALGG